MRPSTQAHPPTHAVRKNRPRTAQPAHQYVYAIIEGAPQGKYDGVGIEGSPLEFICGREVTSVVSALGQDRIRPAAPPSGGSSRRAPSAGCPGARGAANLFWDHRQRAR